jgi:hypothetical protein
VRDILAQCVIRHRYRSQRFREDPSGAEREGLFANPDDADLSLEIGLLISNLADLADPLAVEMIESAFEEDLVSLEVINRATVKSLYEAGGKAQESEPDWLASYRESYANKDTPEREAEPSAPDPYPFPARSSYPSFQPENLQPRPRPVQPIVTIRKATPSIGRNDPCWCGSGKKYKKCHLGKDAST